MAEPSKVKMSIHEETIWARDLGCFYDIKGLQLKAIQFFEKCLLLYEEDEKPKNPYVLYRYGRSLRSIAKTQESLDTSRDALKARDRNAAIALEVANCLYELNRLELTLAHASNYKRKHKGNNAKLFQNKIDALGEHFEDTIGESFLGYVSSNKDAVFEAWKLNEAKKIIDTRPLWKIQKELGNCDVLSVLEKEELLLCPREEARRKRALLVFTQYYLGLSAKDLAFLSLNLKNEDLLLSYSKEITPYLDELLTKSVKDVNSYLRMLHTRNPLYNVDYRKFNIPGQAYSNREVYLNHVQNQTRRAMHNVLRNIKILKKEGKIKKLTEFVEDVMGDYFPEKTLRVMPMKFEFICEVYNRLALAYLEYFEPPLTSLKLRGKAKLFALFKLHEEETKPKVTVFGDKTSYIEEIKNAEASEAYKKYLTRMEKRLFCAQFPIEKSYIYYQIARKHLGLHYYDMCSIAGTRGMREAKLCNSIAWQLLCLLQISKSQVCLQKIEILKDNLMIAYDLACRLKSANLCTFITECAVATTEELMNFKTKRTERHRSQSSAVSEVSA